LHPAGKLLIGAILVIGSVWWILQGGRFTVNNINHSAFQDFITVVNGALPSLVFLLGIFIVWLELDELRIEKELATEERRAKRKR
jgi:hypothetical protein